MYLANGNPVTVKQLGTDLPTTVVVINTINFYQSPTISRATINFNFYSNYSLYLESISNFIEVDQLLLLPEEVSGPEIEVPAGEDDPSPITILGLTEVAYQAIIVYLLEKNPTWDEALMTIETEAPIPN